jgi:hypothetical protein
VTDNLNFGNPERPEIMGSWCMAIKGIGEACRALGFPRSSRAMSRSTTRPMARHPARLAPMAPSAAASDPVTINGLFSLPLSTLRATHESWFPAFMNVPETLAAE